MKSVLDLKRKAQLNCNSDEHLESLLPSIVRLLKRYGYCVIEMWDDSESPLLLLREKLGKGQSHIRANKMGLVSVAPQALSETQGIDIDKYLALKTCEHPPHTDGAYLDGFLLQDGETQWISPPALVLLQCVQSASEGGQSVVIDAQRILEDLLRHKPEIAKVLATPRCVSFCRDDQIALHSAVYENLVSGRYRVRFRCDETLYVVSERAREAVQYFCEHYLANPKYKTTLTLESRQILILDNLRVLHGREKFSDVTSVKNRFLRRTWIADDTLPPAPTSFRKKDGYTCRVFDRFEPYAAIQQTIDFAETPLKLGIHLPGNLQAILDSDDFQSWPLAS